MTTIESTAEEIEQKVGRRQTDIYAKRAISMLLRRTALCNGLSLTDDDYAAAPLLYDRLRREIPGLSASGAAAEAVMRTVGAHGLPVPAAAVDREGDLCLYAELIDSLMSSELPTEV